MQPAATTSRLGEYGLQSLQARPDQRRRPIESGRVVASQAVKGGGKLYIRIFPHKSVTSIPAETRMGKGKGEVEFWAAVVKPGTILYEISGLSEETARGVFARWPPEDARDLPLRHPAARFRSVSRCPSQPNSATRLTSSSIFSSRRSSTICFGSASRAKPSGSKPRARSSKPSARSPASRPVCGSHARSTAIWRPR